MPCTCTYSEKDYLNFICCDAPIVCETWSNDEGVPGQNILLYNTGVGLQPRREGGGGGGGGGGRGSIINLALSASVVAEV